MDIKKIGITSLLCLLIILLCYINIGLNISGPANYEAYKDEMILKEVKKRFPTINDLYRHSFKYVTYSTYNNDKAYLFDNDGKLVVEKEFNIEMLDEIKQIVLNNYGIENAEVNLGFGYDNVVFVVEEEDIIVLFDYDTKEVIYYFRGNLV